MPELSHIDPRSAALLVMDYQVDALCDFVVGGGQHIADDLAIIRLVLDHQNALAHAVSTCRST
jgi:hypothetical protein